MAGNLIGNDTVSETGGGQFDENRYNTEVIYSGSDKDRDFGKTGYGRWGQERSGAAAGTRWLAC